ncbi:hypothetical protein QJS10_CPA05g00775 [Acorus calamus]|uniref:ARM repeat superfamily protein n=1 Tax=Acorus calamus TaxID=4465 RepID=A0AAV9EV58_ACOCL|nr:hypothetical protein QJS10_CPA05g00775 [Acorus calamus]
MADDPLPLSDLLSSLSASASAASSLSRHIPSLSNLLDRLHPTLLRRLAETPPSDLPPFIVSLSSFQSELARAESLLKSPPFTPTAVEALARGLGRCLGLIVVASDGACGGADVGALHRGFMEFRAPDESVAAVAADVEAVRLDFSDVFVRVKNGGDEEDVGEALSDLESLIVGGSIERYRVTDGDVVAVLLGQLGSSCTPENRIRIVSMLRSLVWEGAENKERMADVGALSSIVRSLSRDAEERREAVGLLMDLSDVPKVRQRIGRIQGCILMLVALLNGDDERASCDARKVLKALSGNAQNALHMAEAGYFVPLVKFLKEGSDMNKILMATAISRMDLTDQSRATLGDEGAIEYIVKIFISGKLEAKLSALGALQNLMSLAENIHRLVKSGIIAPLLQLLFSVTSVLMTLREPASAILASIAQSELILINKDVALQMLSLIGLSSPVIQLHLLRALKSITGHPAATKVRTKIKGHGGVQLLLPFLLERNDEIRIIAMNVLYNLSKELGGEFVEQIGETHINIIIDIILRSTSEDERAVSVGILSNLPVNDKKATDILRKSHLLPLLVSLLATTSATPSPTEKWLHESVASILIRFTVSSDKKLQRISAELGVIPSLVKLLSVGSSIAKSRAATSLAQLSQNTISLNKRKTAKWMCVPSPAEGFCEVHNNKCSVKGSFCLIKAGAVPPLVQALEGKEREADEAVLDALSTLVQDEICENGIGAIAKASGVQAIIRVLEVGSVKAQETAVWMLEMIFRIEAHRQQFGDSAQVVLIDLAQKGDPCLKPTVAKILAHLQLLQMQSSYF